MFYMVKTPVWLKKLYNKCIWEIPDNGDNIYLTFDDGPHPTITPFVLAELKKYNAKATFFCIGENVTKFPAIFNQIITEGHSIGNHTHNHLNGWKTDDKTYLDNILTAQKYISSNLFRPPYGRIKRSQLRKLSTIPACGGTNSNDSRLRRDKKLSIIMWTVLSADFDSTLSPEKCLQNVLRYTRSGSIVVFHDSEKAEQHLRYALPKVLSYFSEKGYSFQKLPMHT